MLRMGMQTGRSASIYNNKAQFKPSHLSGDGMSRDGGTIVQL